MFGEFWREVFESYHNDSTYRKQALEIMYSQGAGHLGKSLVTQHAEW